MARNVLLSLVFAVAAMPAAVHGEIYRCTDGDGSITYSQTPCAKETATVARDAVPAVENPQAPTLECDYANKFAVTTARLMRAGAKSDEVFNRYGGIDSMSRGTVGVINYVYSFRTNDGVSIERIAGLTRAKCEARAFGILRCESLPLSFIDDHGGCEGEGSGAAGSDPSAGAVPAARPDAALRPQVAYGRTAREDERAKQAVEQCKKMYRDQIDRIDEQMRRGYTSEQGERYREQLRGLSQKLRACGD